MKKLFLLSLLATTTFAQDNAGLKLFELLDTANDRSGNLAFSPASATTALHMAALGAEPENKTYVEFTGAIGNPVFAPLQKRDELLVANAAFCHEATTFTPEYITLLKDVFNATAKTLDFSQPEPVRATINAWVAEQTRDKIKDLLPPNSLTADSRLVLVNALYFNDDWLIQFRPHSTRPRAFNSASGNTQQIPFMHNTHTFNCAERDDVQILQLPYKNGCVMNIFLPRGNDLAPAFALLNQGFAKDLQPARVSVALPKFTINWQGSLKASLQQLGIREAFTPDADFSRITRDEKLFITDVFQAVFIAVGERGTEAAAATGVGFAVTSVDLIPPVEFIADRPFLFTLATPDNTLLFTGVVREL